MNRFVLSLAIFGVASLTSISGIAHAADLDPITARQVFSDEKGRFHADWAAGVNRPSFILSRLAILSARNTTPATAHSPLVTMSEQSNTPKIQATTQKVFTPRVVPTHDGKNHLIQ